MAGSVHEGSAGSNGAPEERVRERGESLAAFTPLAGKVIAEPMFDPPQARGFWTNYRVQYPQAAWVVAKGEGLRENIQLGDLILIEVESVDVAASYPLALEITFDDGHKALFDVEIEPIVREAVERYRANPSANKGLRLTMAALNGEGYRALASDVVDYQIGKYSTPEFGLLHPLRVKMFGLWEGIQPVLFYEVHEDHILGVIRDEHE